MNKAFFYIHGKDAEKTAYLMRKVLQKKTFIKVSVENGECIISSREISGSISTWLCDYLINSKKFMGKFHEKHIAHNKYQKNHYLGRYKQVPSRFGFFECNDIDEYDFHQYCKIRTQQLLMGVPEYLAEKRAFDESGYVDQVVDTFKVIRRKSFIKDLVVHHNKNVKEATKLVDVYFSHYNIVPKEPTEEEIRARHERIQNKSQELIEILKFYSPKQRRRYLEDPNNFTQFFLAMNLILTKGHAWFIENCGEIEGIT